MRGPTEERVTHHIERVLFFEEEHSFFFFPKPHRDNLHIESNIFLFYLYQVRGVKNTVLATARASVIDSLRAAGTFHFVLHFTHPLSAARKKKQNKTKQKNTPRARLCRRRRCFKLVIHRLTVILQSIISVLCIHSSMCFTNSKNKK